MTDRAPYLDGDADADELEEADDLRRIIGTAPHEFAGHLNFNADGLRQWFAADRIVKDGGGSVEIEAADLDALADDDLGFYLDDSESVSWVTRNSTLWSIKSLTGNDRQYDRGLLNQGDGKELVGYPVETSNKVDAPGTTNKPLLFGNFNFVGKREEPGFTVLRDPYSRAEEGIVQLHYYFRTVYKVLQSKAVGYGQNA